MNALDEERGLLTHVTTLGGLPEETKKYMFEIIEAREKEISKMLDDDEEKRKKVKAEYK